MSSVVRADAWPQHLGHHLRRDAFVGIGDHELDAGEAPGPQRAQEREPERSVFAVTNAAAQDFARIVFAATTSGAR